MKIKVIKSKVCEPMGECEVPLFFDRGFVSFSDVSSIRKELMIKEAAMHGKKVSTRDMDDYEPDYEDVDGQLEGEDEEDE